MTWKRNSHYATAAMAILSQAGERPIKQLQEQCKHGPPPPPRPAPPSAEQAAAHEDRGDLGGDLGESSGGNGSGSCLEVEKPRPFDEPIAKLSELVVRCWAEEKNDRPRFAEIVRIVTIAQELLVQATRATMEFHTITSPRMPQEAKRYGAAAADAAAAAVLASVNSITFGRLMAHNVSFFLCGGAATRSNGRSFMRMQPIQALRSGNNFD